MTDLMPQLKGCLNPITKSPDVLCLNVLGQFSSVLHGISHLLARMHASTGTRI